MSIIIDEQKKIITLHTRNTTYQMRVGHLGHLIHLYYGRRVGGDSLASLYPRADRGFSPDYYQTREQRGVASPDTRPQEYTGFNVGDFRLSCVEVTGKDGALGADFRCTGWAVAKGKYLLDGLPAARDEEGEAETLTVTLEDPVAGLRLELLYGVFERQDILTRAARLTNLGTEHLILDKVASICLDIPFGEWDLIHFHGRHAMERQPERRPLMQGIQTVSSKRGASSHHHNPFVILCNRQANEDGGGCYGVMLAYSGSHRTDIELDYTGSVRVVSGIHDELFRWTLHPGERFTAPEVLLTFSHQGLSKLSQRYHRFLRRNMCRSKFRELPRPVLINNWEATYFDFTSEKLCEIARQAAALGVELLVLDDGWFGKRDDDNSGLGDWNVNESKLPGGLTPLIERVGAMGMQFGIWIEPEMVSEDSDLYRAHPDWALQLPGRTPAMGRNQLALDLGREEVVEHLTAVFSDLLRRYPIRYVKWDMNRNLSDIYSSALPRERQGEASHRYMLGVYRLLEQLTTAFPEVLFEGCAGGGGRFDAGMLAYCPQIWCSDDTDAVERLTIQCGTSYGYPVSAVGSHVSAVPNHQTGRTAPLGTRAVVAMSGAFGYELDLRILTEEERAAIKEQIQYFKKHSRLIQCGDYYRLTGVEGEFTAWQTVAEDRSETLVSLVVTRTRANASPIHFTIKGLDAETRYRLADFRVFGNRDMPFVEKPETLRGVEHTGAALMYAGITLPQLFGDYPSAQLYFVRVP